MILYRIILSVFLLLTASSAWSMSPMPDQSRDSLGGKVAPDTVLPKTDGTSSSVIATREGKKAILIFWATWCPHCFEEIGFINSNYKTIENKGIKIILIDIGEAKEDVKNYFKQRQFNLVSFVDENSFLQETYHLNVVPTVIFIDEKGVIRNVVHTVPSDYESYFGVQQ